MAIEFYSSIDVNQNDIHFPVIHKVSSAPSSPSAIAGQMYYNTSANTMHFHNGTGWQTVGTSSAVGDITSVVAGTGLTGGGTDGDVTVNVIGGDGITANANDIAITAGLIADGSNITSVGTIGTGVWQGTVVASAYLDADTAHLSGSQTFTGTKTLNSFKGTGGATVTNILDEDAMGSDSATALATQQSIKAYADTKSVIAGNTSLVTLGTVTTGVWNGTAIASSYIAADAITGAKIADDAIDSEHYTDGSIDNAHIADNAIDSEHYADGSIDNAHIADDAIDSEHYAAGSIDTAHIADDQITLAKMAGLATTKFILGDGSGNPAAVSMSGDATMSNAGAVTVTQSAGDFTVTGDLIVSGDTTTVNTATLSVEDPLISMASGNGANSVDIGIWGKYTATGAKYTGLFRDASDSNMWKLFATTGNSHETPGTGTTINTTSGFTYANLTLATLTGDVTGDVTGDLTGQADTVATIAGLAPNTATTQATQGSITSAANLATVGTIGTGVWNGTAVASAYLDADTAHLTTAQTFTGSKTMGTTVKFNFRDANSYIYSPTANDLEIVATDITLDAANSIILENDVIFTDKLYVDDAGGEYISGNGTTATMTGAWAAANMTITGGAVSGITDIAIADGGTGASTASAAFTALKQAASTSATGVVELATAAEVLTGTATAQVVTADTLSAKSVVGIIDVSSLTDTLTVTIPHNLGTADVIVQMYDTTTEANVYADIARTTDDMSTASTSSISIDFGAAAPPNDIRVLITSLAGASASGTVAYT